MTYDLVKRLRDVRHMTQAQGLSEMLKTAHEAADEIDRLRARNSDLFLKNLRLHWKVEGLEAKIRKTEEGEP